MKTIFGKPFSKECKYIEKKVVRNIHNNLSDFSSSNESDKEYMSG